jgi:Zn-dependent M28 family amino/carboxypeptidase
MAGLPAEAWFPVPAFRVPVVERPPPVIEDPDTREWWRITGLLGSDAMEGRDTGSAGYDRAADIVVAGFEAAGLRPAGDDGSWFQQFGVHETRVEPSGTAIAVARHGGGVTRLRFPHQVTVQPSDDLPGSVDAPMVFRGYCAAADLAGVKGRAVLCFNTKRAGMTTAAERVAAAHAAGAAALVQVDDPQFALEPPRWLAAYARSVRLAEDPAPAASSLPVLTLHADAFAEAIAGSGRDAARILQLGADRKPLPAFEIPARLQARFELTRRDYTGKNVLALLPGTGPELAREYLVLSAHLDGYGYGEPVDGDGLYNGTFDDAAYVASLLRFADRRRAQPLQRSVLFAAFAGEEKGMLGSTWFVRHPTVPGESIAANINLDQLRPLFPLQLLTVLALEETSLGRIVRDVAGRRGIAVQSDLEPERNLLRRADHWPFLQAGIPATGFIFGYAPGSEADRRYRTWYRARYHRPQDDAGQPVDFEAAGAFNRFFYELAEQVADVPERPVLLTSPWPAAAAGCSWCPRPGPSR